MSDEIPIRIECLIETKQTAIAILGREISFDIYLG